MKKKKKKRKKKKKNGQHSDTALVVQAFYNRQAYRK